MNARTVATSIASSSLSSLRTFVALRIDPLSDSLPACGVVASGYGGIRVGGPYFDDLSKGQVFDWAPGSHCRWGWRPPISRSWVTGYAWLWTPTCVRR